MNIFKLIKIWTLIITLVVSLPSLASTSATGTIQATQTCEAYVSKNKRTNPDNTKLVVDQTYLVSEVNRPVNPGWYRVHIQNASPTLRWVADHCGTVNVQIGSGPVSQPSGACNTSGQEDSYKLALSWQPAFCETHRDKPECHVTDQKAYQARNFTLHGLWPNKKSCGTGYGYCGEVRNKPGHFCDYPALSLATEIRLELEQVMPSARAGSCLQRHEWHKHGTCQTKWSIDKYHQIASDLTRQFNESGIAYFISRNIGKQVDETDFYKRVDCALGENAHKRMRLKCKGGNLVDIYINLPKNLVQGELLGAAVLRANPDFKSGCNGSFRIDPIGFAN